MVFACTYCSKEKSLASGLIPAKERYFSERINKVITLSAQEGLPLLFLSGKYGLIVADKKIPYYNLRLVEDSVSKITEFAIRQAKDLKITKLIFYAKPKGDKLKPYYEVIEVVCDNLGIELSYVVLTD